MFRINRSNLFEKRDRDLSYYLTFDPEVYNIIKGTRHQKLVTYDEFLDFKYSSYVFFKKDKYDINKILNWVNYFIELGGVQYLVKATPPFNPMKIIIRK